jgi:hypothetical protein
VTVAKASHALSWSAASLSGGGEHKLQPCSVPDNARILGLASLASHVICVESRSRRFFWLRPGEVDIDPLDFSSAESEPDEIVDVVSVGDQFWLFGQSSSEVWYASGQSDQPFMRAQGRAFSQGIVPGTAALVQDAVMVVGQDKVAYSIAGAPNRVSHHGIEEKLRAWLDEVTPEPAPFTPPSDPEDPNGPNPGALTAGTAEATAQSDTRVLLSATPASGGVQPYRYQWYVSTASGVTGVKLHGATGLRAEHTGLAPASTWYYTLMVLDASGEMKPYAQQAATTLQAGASAATLSVVVADGAILDGSAPAMFTAHYTAALVTGASIRISRRVGFGAWAIVLDGETNAPGSLTDAIPDGWSNVPPGYAATESVSYLLEVRDSGNAVYSTAGPIAAGVLVSGSVESGGSGSGSGGNGGGFFPVEIE